MPELAAEEHSAVLNLFQQYGDAWGRRDARGCATLFASDGDLIAADGEVCTGPTRFRPTTIASCPDPTGISPSAILKWAPSVRSVPTPLS